MKHTTNNLEVGREYYLVDDSTECKGTFLRLDKYGDPVFKGCDSANNIFMLNKQGEISFDGADEEFVLVDKLTD